MRCCNLSKCGGPVRGVLFPNSCYTSPQSRLQLALGLFPPVFPEGCVCCCISLPFLTSPPPTHKSWKWKGAGQGQMRMEASAFFLFFLLLFSLCQLSIQHAWPGWTSLTTCPILRWKFIQRKKKRRKTKRRGIAMWSCSRRGCRITGAGWMVPASNPRCLSSRPGSMCLCSVLLSQPNPAKKTQEKREVSWDWAASLLLVASKFKQQHLHLGKDGLEGAQENSSPYRIDWASLWDRLRCLSSRVKSMGLLTEEGYLVRVGW